MAVKKKILAVDDDAGICQLYESGLPPMGFDVTCAASGKQAQTFLKKELPDLILMDIMMPDIDGITLTREILSQPRTSKIPILIVSGLSDAATLNDALLFGAVDYVVKPLDFDVLKTKIDRILGLK
ncbi:MAG: response regulator [Elusimicrobiota bacterium]|jgi:CheY-like chemotaxis protein